MDPFLVLVRLAQYAALLPLFGLYAFAVYAPQTPGTPTPILRALILTGLAATVLDLFALSISMAGAISEGLALNTLWIVLTSTAAGCSVIVRVVVLTAAFPMSRRARPWLLVFPTGVAAASLAFGGHANSGEGLFRLARLSADLLHLLAAGVWTGALGAFLALTRRGGSSPAAIEALTRFSGVGSAAVAVLMVSGAINALAIMGWPPPPLIVPWTALMAVKLLLFAGMTGLAVLNRFWLAPRLRATGDVGRLRVSLLLETGLAAGVIILVSVLGTLMPPMRM